MERDFAIWREFDAVFLGRLVKGTFSMSHEGLVTVKTLIGSKATQLGNPPAIFVAKGCCANWLQKEKHNVADLAFANLFAAMQRVFCFQESGS
jgi:hypothetical protein